MSTFWANDLKTHTEILKVQDMVRETLRSRSKNVSPVIDHVLDSEGKYVRAGMVILAAQNGDYDSQRTVPVAAAVEMLHLATLIHDDIIDESEFRRGKRSVQSKFGKDVAVYTGDFVLSKTFSLLSENHTHYMLPLSKAIERICMGEIMQNENKHNTNLTKRQYLRIISGKTASLFAVSLHAGAVEGQLDEMDTRVLRNSGLHVGMAFQIIDDCLDYLQDSESTQDFSGFNPIEILGGTETFEKLANAYTAKALKDLSKTSNCKNIEKLEELYLRLVGRNA